ncbi:hypothetical protein [Ralstonia mannitolilytica]|uniref:hypothetical protein n=1 Tax=Ralstonia mannitolilytica TaxID=105219 RepID=UPI001C9790CC|nr:hypothetical protein [Ralstonia mannitolilytica]MBY4717543.1 hypothetical protein [Ralstonia mannitolilytica]
MGALWNILKMIFRPVADFFFFYLSFSFFVEAIPGIFLWIYSRIFEKTTYVDYMNFLDKWNVLEILALGVTIWLLLFRTWILIVAIREHILNRRNSNQSAMG